MKYIGKSRMRKLLNENPALRKHLSDVEPEAFEAFEAGEVTRETLETLSAECEEYLEEFPAIYEEYFG